MIAPASPRLVYVTDDQPGYTRRRCGRGFTYLDPDGKTVRDKRLRQRFDAIVIPPAWNNVWICASPRGHLQATGRDARRRKVYRYHEAYSEIRNALKFSRLPVFGAALPALRQRLESDLRKRSLCRERVIAIAVELMQSALLRVGNESYAAENNTFGLTTLRNRHVELSTRRIKLQFTAKSGKLRDVTVEDRSLAHAAQRLNELPGQRLFQYRDDNGNIQPIGSADINDYLQQTTGLDLTAKDFRTWFGTVLCADHLRHLEPPDTEKDADRQIVQAIKHTSAALGNTQAVCRKYYVHPLILDLHRAGTLADALNQRSHPLGRINRDLLKPAEQDVLAALLSHAPL